MEGIRRLWPTERAQLRDLLLRLGPDERHERFGNPRSDAAIEAYVAELDWHGELVLGFFEEGVLRGAAQLVPLTRLWPKKAELAVTVEPAWQSRGIGTELTRRTLLAARNLGITEVVSVCLMDNLRMQHIVRRLGARVSWAEGEADAVILLPPPTPFTLWDELAAESRAGLAELGRYWPFPPPSPSAAAR